MKRLLAAICLLALPLAAQQPIVFDRTIEAPGFTTGGVPVGGGSPGGADTQVQYNNAGSFGGSAAMVYAAATGNLTLTQQVVAGVPLAIQGMANQTGSLLTLTAGATPVATGGLFRTTLVSTTDPGIVVVPPASYTGRTLAFGLDAATPSGATLQVGTPAQVAASTAGNPLNLTASAAIAGSSVAGAAAGGDIAFVAGNAARLTSGDARGGDFLITHGTPIGTQRKGVFRFGSNSGFQLVGTPNIFAVGDPNGLNSVYFGVTTNGAMVRSGGYLQWSSSSVMSWGTSSDPTNWTPDLYLSRGGTATLQLGTANAAVPISQTLRSQGSRGGTDTNAAGGSLTIFPGLGTGSAPSGDYKVQSGYAGSTGTTQNTATDRFHVESAWTTLTESAATGFATLTYAASTAVGARFMVTVEANDGTEYQSLTSSVRVSSVRKAAGNTVSAIGLDGADVPAVSSGTLTCTYTVTDGASAVTVNANCVSSLTQTVLRASFVATANGPVTVAGL